MRPVLPEGEFYTDQVLGMKVLTETGHDLGEVEEVLETPAHDIYCTSQVMIPAVPEYILKRDFESNVITIPDSVECDE
jgi:16S rRNA processing protein RimM